MSSDSLPALGAPALWIVPQRVAAAHRRCRDYRLCDVTGGTLLNVRAYIWGRDIVASTPLSHEARLRLRRRRLFPLSGRADVLLLPDEQQLGTLQRSGGFADARGRPLGRFQDARSLRERARESLVQAAAEALLGGDGTASYPSAADGYVWLGPDGAVAGTLARRVLPFAGDEPQVDAGVPSAGHRVLSRVRRIVGAVNAPRGWLLERHATHRDADPVLVVCAALFTVELSRW